jgi:chromosome segregation ATPase
MFMTPVLIAIAGLSLVYLTFERIRGLIHKIKSTDKVQKEAHEQKEMISSIQQEISRLKEEKDDLAEQLRQVTVGDSPLAKAREKKFKIQFQLQEQRHEDEYIALKEEKDRYVAETQEVRVNRKHTPARAN